MDNPDGVKLKLQRGQTFTAAGIFKVNGEKYVISKAYHDKGQWYGVPLDQLSNEDEELNMLLDDINLDDDLDELDERLRDNKLSTREKIIAILGRMYNALAKIADMFSKNKNKK